MTPLQTENILSYSGSISFDKINDLLNTYKEEVEDFDINPVVEKRLFSVIVESLENAYRHKIKSTNKEKLNNVSFDICYSSDEILVKVSNYTLTKSAIKAKSKIDEINHLNTDEIKKLYKTSIASAKISTVGGAGLGLIEIAKNTKQKIKYRIEDIKDSISFFEISTTIPNIQK